MSFAIFPRGPRRESAAHSARVIPFVLSLLLGSALAVWVGCGKQGDNDDDAENVGGGAAAAEAAPQSRDIWEAIRMGRNRVGYEHVSVRNVTQGGRTLRKVQGESVTEVKRNGQPTTTIVRCESTETLDGELLSFNGVIGKGGQEIHVSAVVDGDTIRRTVSTQTNTREDELPWKPEYRGPLGVAQSLWADPMDPGEERTIVTFSNEGLSTNEMVARQVETVEIDGRRHDLLRIDNTVTFMETGGGSLDVTLWIDENGSVLRRRIAGLLENYVTTEEKAKRGDHAGEVDFMLDISVPIDAPIERPHQAREVRYRVTLPDADPGKFFSSGVSQKVEPLDVRSALVTVYAVRPDALPPHASESEPASDKDIEPNLLITSDAPSVVRLADDVAVPPEAGAWETALAVERLVHERMRSDDYSKMLSPAAEVADTLTGDCTEYAVLTAALLRHFKIPARVAVGLVAMDRELRYHMWTEAHIDGHWIPIDATLGLGGIGGGHLKIADSTLDDPVPIAALLPMFQVVGKLQVEEVVAVD